MPNDTYTIADLARLSGVSVRTIRYYLTQGLLPSPGESGPGAHYGEDHLARLRLIRRLQAQHQPLAEIRTRLSGLSAPEIATLAAADEPSAPSPSTSALDYVRGVLGSTQGSTRRQASGSLLKRIDRMPSLHEPAAPLASAPAELQPLERSQWERLSLGPNLELHIRRPLSRLEQKRVERLVTIARQVLKEDMP